MAVVSVTATGQIFYCPQCGNEVMTTKVGGGTLFCCGKPMELIDSDDTAEDAESPETEE